MSDSSKIKDFIFFAFLFMLFAVFLAENALGKQNGKALCVCFSAAFLVQLAALIYSLSGVFAPIQLVVQKISAGFLFAAVLISFVVIRKKQKS